MNQPLVQSSQGITLVGGAPCRKQELMAALKAAPVLVAADGGADRALELGLRPQAVIGDLDSLSTRARAEMSSHELHVVSGQDDTDFDKALKAVEAPLLLGVGFLGGRIDHTLAAMSTLVRHAGRPCILLGARDVVLAAPTGRIGFDLVPGDRFSLYPLCAAPGESCGLRWPIAGLDLRPDGMIGTSNEVVARRVELRFERPGMLVILPRNRLGAAIKAWQRP